jgi:hypothetical protein
VFAQEYTEPELNIKQTKVQEGIESLRVCRPIRGQVHFSDVDVHVLLRLCRRFVADNKIGGITAE